MKQLELAGLLLLSALLLMFSSCEDVFQENLESKVKLATEALDTPEVSGPDSTNNSKPTWEWTTPEGTVNFRYQMDGTGGIWTETSGNQATSYTPLIDLAEGEHTLNVQALGPSGKWSGTGSKTTLVDLSAPTVSAGDDISWTNTAVTLAGTSSDSMGITSLWEVVPESSEIIFLDTSSLTSTVEGPAGSEGAYTLKLTCTDALGHYATDELVLNWDSKAPVPGNGGVFTFSDETIDSITLNWTAAEDLDKAAADLEYKILGSTSDNLSSLAECGTTGDGRFTVSDWTAGITSVTAEGLNPAVPYYFNILVRDTLKQESLYRINSCTLNPVPQNVSVLLQPSDNLKISWTAVTGASGYRVYRSTVEDGPYTQIGGDISTTEYFDDGLPAKIIYWYKVKAFKDSHESILSAGASGGLFSVAHVGPAGGIIIYKDATDDYPGWTYLEMAPDNQGLGILWYNDPDLTDSETDYYTYTAASGTVLGTGKSNTEAIVTKQGDGSYAAIICAGLVLGGYDDWFLPSKDELNLMYEITSIESFGLVSNNYWSSSEDSLMQAWIQNIGTGHQEIAPKHQQYLVRAIRAF